MMPFKEITRLDKLVHEPARLAILSALAACKIAEFLFLQELTGMTKGNLSSHLAKLEKGELVKIEKQFIRNKIPHTTIQITPRGQRAIQKHWEQLAAIQDKIEPWKD
ncbi:transcriptional regulator [Mechercharimyces sp. CAU 1602]|uniref:transcriptional regulator n=1 Tax=Mechercharimyces sp. CAU 1602 TaxID=2973933 RepID=UPI0021633E2B|nr:transcriptional regulator [Mechercharimyces sp. CAU 1602]MCS1351113.1 transcriptional regulator [Mechercharimyces sp. CAU 1602]